MIKRLFAMILFIAQLNMIVGCTRMANISPEEAQKIERLPKKKITGVILPMVLDGIKLKSGDEIYFNEPGGIIDNKLKTLRGVAKDGSKIETKLSDLQSILIVATTVQGSLLIESDIESFVTDAGKKPWKMNNGRFAADGEVIEFDENGGDYDSEQGIIKGKTAAGQDIEISTKDVHKIKFRWLGPPTFFQLVGGTALVLGTIVIIGIIGYSGRDTN